MARLIDTDKLGMYLADDQLANRGWRDDVCELLDDVMYALEEAPTIDAVEVVRCKDCKYWNNGDCYRLELSRPDDFCSYGERKE